MNEKTKIIIFICFGIVAVIGIAMQIHHVFLESYHKNMSFEGVVVKRDKFMKFSALLTPGGSVDSDQDTNFYLYVQNSDLEIIKFKTSRHQFITFRKGAHVIKYSGERYLEAVEE